VQCSPSMVTSSFCVRLLSTSISWDIWLKGYEISVREEMRSKRTSAVQVGGASVSDERSMSISGFRFMKPAEGLDLMV